MRTVLVCACTLMAAAVRDGGAQVPDSAVADSAGRPRPAVRLDPIVVTATRVPLRRDKIGSATSLVTPLPLEAGDPAVRSLASLPGVSLDEAAGPGGPTIVRIRGGEEVFTQILMDGVQVNQNGGFFDFQGLALSNLDRVEVARGPLSALYGSSAVSGVVQYVTRAGLPGRSRVDWSTSGGTATERGGTFRSSASVSGGVPRFRYSSGYGVAYQRGIFAVPHDIWSRDGSLRLDASPSGRVDLTGVFRLTGMDANLPVRDAGATRVPLDPKARTSRDRIVASLRASAAATAAWRHEVVVSMYHETFVYDDQYDGVDGTPLGIFIFDANFTQRSTLRRASANYLATVSTGGLRHPLELSYGAGVEREDLRDRTAGDFGPGDLPLGRSARALHAEVHAQPVERLSLLAGSRLELIPGVPGQFTPRGSVVFDLLPGRLAVRAAVGRAFKTPNLQQQYLDNPFIVSNPDLRPETSVSWEAGVTAGSRDRRFTLALGYFHQQYRDLIRTVAVPGGTQQINRNLGDSKADGVEWELRIRPAGAFEAGLAGAWLKTTILDNAGLSPTEYPDGGALPFRPSVTATAYANVPVSRRLSVTPRASLVGAQTVLSERFSGQRVRLPAYTLVGFTAALQAAAWAEPFVRVDNLFNQKYQTGFDRRGIPLTVEAGLRVSR